MVEINQSIQHLHQIETIAGNISRIIRQGVVVQANQVLLPNRSRASEMTCGDPATGLFRRKTSEGLWIYGEIVKIAGDLIFEDSPTQTTMCSFSDLPLPTLLNNNSDIKEFVKDFDCAIELFSGLAGKSWTDGKSTCSFNYVEAGKYIASLRNVGECYSDYLFRGSPGYITSQTMEILGEFDWYPVDPDAQVEDSKLATRILHECESRPASQLEPWVFYYHDIASPGDREVERMIRCCLEGKAKLSEWEQFYLNFDLEANKRETNLNAHFKNTT